MVFCEVIDELLNIMLMIFEKEVVRLQKASREREEGAVLWRTS